MNSFVFIIFHFVILSSLSDSKMCCLPFAGFKTILSVSVSLLECWDADPCSATGFRTGIEHSTWPLILLCMGLSPFSLSLCLTPHSFVIGVNVFIYGSTFFSETVTFSSSESLVSLASLMRRFLPLTRCPFSCHQRKMK